MPQLPSIAKKKENNEDVPVIEDKRSGVPDIDFERKSSFLSHDQDEKEISISGKTIDDTEELIDAPKTTEDSSMTKEPEDDKRDNSLDISSNDDEIPEVKNTRNVENSNTNRKNEENASNMSIDISNSDVMYKEIEIDMADELDLSENTDGDESHELTDFSSNDHAMHDDTQTAQEDDEVEMEDDTKESVIENKTYETEKTITLENERNNDIEESINKLLEKKDHEIHTSKVSESSPNDHASYDEISWKQKNDKVEVEEDIKKSMIGKEVRETEKITASEDETNNDMEESIDEVFIQKTDDETHDSILPSLDVKTKGEKVQNDTGMGTTDINVEGGNEEEEVSSKIPSSSLENNVDQEFEERKNRLSIEGVETNDKTVEVTEEYHTAPDSSSEKTTYSQLESIDTNQDMDVGVYSVKANNQNSKQSLAEEVSMNEIRDNVVLEKRMQSQNHTHEVDKIGKTNEKVEALQNDESSLDTNSFMMNKKHKPSEELPNSNDRIDNDGSIIDLDIDPDIFEAKNDTDDKVDQNSGHRTTLKNHIEEGDTSVVENELLKAKDQHTTETSNDAARGEVHSTKNASIYRGEPWGQYRPTRRIPDLELLQLLFENSNKTSLKRNSGDIKSQNVINNWQKDPLYDENMTFEGLSQQTLLVDENDESFVKYRSRLLGGDIKVDASAKPDYESKQLVDNPQENAKKSDDNNGKSNNADVNSEFVEGIDDIANFFEGVDPPDELDVGYGSSIQDVLMDKGKHILLKKARGIARWIQLGLQTMTLKIKERISQLKLTFQTTDKMKTTSSDIDVPLLDSSKSKATKKQNNQTLENIRVALIFALKTGKDIYEKTSDFVDRLLDRLDGRIEDDSTNFEDFNGFDLDDLSRYQPPS